MPSLNDMMPVDNDKNLVETTDDETIVEFKETFSDSVDYSIPDGDYHLKIISVDRILSKKNNTPQIVITFEGVETVSKGKKFKRFYSLDERGISMLTKDNKAFKLSPGKNGSIAITKLNALNKIVKSRLSQNEYRNEKGQLVKTSQIKFISEADENFTKNVMPF